MLAHATWGGYLFWIALPSCLWIFVPAAFVYAYGKVILKALYDMKEKAVQATAKVQLNVYDIPMNPATLMGSWTYVQANFRSNV